jgi:serine O-acetyltransferase
MIRADRRRFRQWYGIDFSGWHPGYICVVLYRISHYLHRAGHKYAARVVWHCNGVLTGGDIAPAVEIGPGLLIPCPAGVAIAGKVGRNFTVLMCSGLGSELGRHEDVGAGAGLPLVGDDVFLEAHTGVLGPVRVGNRVRIKAGAVLTTDIPDDSVALAPAARFFAAVER